MSTMPNMLQMQFQNVGIQNGSLKMMSRYLLDNVM